MNELTGGYQPPDTVVLRSAGIDVGTATTQLIISRLTLKRMGRAHSSRYVVAARDTVFESPVIFTPYLGPTEIDAESLVAAISEWLDEASAQGEIETGVVLLTGEAVRRHNAKPIADRISRLAGDFVCAAAGDIYEAQMAAKGSGAIEISRRMGRVLNIDIGGGTTKLSVIEHGEIIDSSVVRVGSRGIVVDDKGLVTRLEVSGRLASEQLGSPIDLGGDGSDSHLSAVASWMVERIDEQIFGIPAQDPGADLRITGALSDVGEITGVLFSSGVAEYIHGRTSKNYGDLGAWMAQAVDEKRGSGKWGWDLLPVDNPLRATALGISQYTVEVSGDTIYSEQADLLPLRNRRVVAVDLRGVPEQQFENAMRHAASEASLESVSGGIAWRLFHRIGRRYPELAAFAQALGDALVSLDGGASLVILDEDLAMTVGILISEELSIKSDIIVLDGTAADAAFLDIGRYQPESGIVPVVLKSLVLDEPR